MIKLENEQDSEAEEKTVSQKCLERLNNCCPVHHSPPSSPPELCISLLQFAATEQTFKTALSRECACQRETTSSFV